MNGHTEHDVIHRASANPLVTLNNLSFSASDIYDAGVVSRNGEILLLITVETLIGKCVIYLGRSHDGLQFEVEPFPFMVPQQSGPFAEGEEWGIRDARITELEGTYYITYLAEGDLGLRVGLAQTDNFRQVKRICFVGEPDTKGGALFPEKIGGRYAILTRPQVGSNIWISYSDDLLYWGDMKVVMTPRTGYWDAHRVGVGAPPILTEHGWILIYYGAKTTSGGPLYRLGAVLLDLEDPSRVIARSNIPILAPREPFERIGDIGNLVFTCGAVLRNGGDVFLYYGAADSCICLGTTTVSEIIDTCLLSSKER